MPEICRLNQQIFCSNVRKFWNYFVILGYFGLNLNCRQQEVPVGLLLSAMSSKWNQHCLGILAIVIVNLLCSLSNTFATLLLLLKGAFSHHSCILVVVNLLAVSAYLTLLGVCGRGTISRSRGTSACGRML